MNLQETTALLAKIRLGDNREVTQAVVLEWHNTLGDLDFEDACTAVTMHRRESLAYLMPAHIVANVRRIREARSMRADGAGLPELPRGGGWAPKPHNFDAMSRAWNNPRKFQEEVRHYYNQVNGQDAF